MKLSDLLAAYGDDKVQVQNLDECAKSMNMNGGTTTVTFGTEQRVHFEGMEKLGLIVWLDRERVKEIIASANPVPTPDGAVEALRVADALEACDWSGPSIGNKAILQKAVELLRSAAPAAKPEGE